MTDTLTARIFGETLEIRWDGNVWVSPSNGQQHAHARDAMRTEAESLIRESGDDPDEDRMRTAIEFALSKMAD
jgi:hypothetical protein